MNSKIRHYLFPITNSPIDSYRFCLNRESYNFDNYGPDYNDNILVSWKAYNKINDQEFSILLILMKLLISD